jgi:hypothetical protein
MNAAKRNAATSAKTTAKKTTARKPRPKRPPAPPMNELVRAFAAGIMGTATESALASEHLGVKRQATSELGGARSGLVNRITLDDGTRLVVQVLVRQPSVRRRKVGEADG